MVFHYAGKYNGKEETLPKREHPENSVPLKEAETMERLSMFVNMLALVFTAIFLVIMILRIFFSENQLSFTQLFSGFDFQNFFFKEDGSLPIIKTLVKIIFLLLKFLLVTLFPFVVIIPHEFLHAICFKKDVYMYENLKQGMVFVTGVEDMSKARFIFMSLLPNMVFGVLPYIVFLCYPQWYLLGFFSAICIGMGAGDYYNVFNVITQVPNEALVYMSGMHSYWYRPQVKQ